MTPSRRYPRWHPFITWGVLGSVPVAQYLWAKWRGVRR